MLYFCKQRLDIKNPEIYVFPQLLLDLSLILKTIPFLFLFIGTKPFLKNKYDPKNELLLYENTLVLLFLLLHQSFNG